jgi:hypothetical protein
MSRVDDLSVIIKRPTDIRRLIDFMFAASPVASAIDPNRIGFFGFLARRLYRTRPDRRQS